MQEDQEHPYAHRALLLPLRANQPLTPSPHSFDIDSAAFKRANLGRFGRDSFLTGHSSRRHSKEEKPMSARRVSLFLAGVFFSAAAWASGPSTSPFPTPLKPINPRGSLMYGNNTSGSIGFVGEEHSYTLSVDPGQTITVLVVPEASPGFQPHLDLKNPSNFLIGSATAATPGKPALLETASASAAGTYTMIVSGVSGTTGDYVIGVFLNLAIEAEDVPGNPKDDTIATAQNIDGSSFSLG